MSEPVAWQYPVYDFNQSNYYQEESISSLEKHIYTDFGLFDLVEKDEQNEENDRNNKDQVNKNKSDFDYAIIPNDVSFLIKQRCYTTRYLLSQKISMLVLFHAWKFHI